MNEEEISTEAIKSNNKNLNIPSNQPDTDRDPSVAGKSIHATALNQQLSGNKIRKLHCIMQTEV
jgi:hypothetical protein